MQTKLLVVDDEMVIAFALESYFRAVGFDVDAAGELEEAQALMANVRYDVVIADLSLGNTGREGLEVIKAAREYLADIPVVLLTAFGTPEIGRCANELGASAVLSKSLSLQDVERTVQSLLAARS